PVNDKLIVPVKVEGDQLRRDIVRAINSIVSNRNTNNVKVINISISMGEIPNTTPIENDPDIYDAINGAYNVGILTVITAGNSNKPVPLGSISHALVVGGTAKNSNTRWSGSHYGTRVDIAAPAEAIILPTFDNKYISVPGTSYAAPMVAATA